MRDPRLSYQRLIAEREMDPLYSEFLLENAVERWLSPSTEPFPRAGTKRLAALAQKNHRDRWLQAFLDSPSSPKALRLLRSAITADDRGNHEKAAQDARKAERLFREDGNQAGAARSRFQLVYALHRQSEGEKCLREAGPLYPVVEANHYSWIETQLLIETSICQGFTGQFNEESRFIEQALANAKRFHYPISQLRALGIAASFDTSEGRLRESWNRNEMGLKAFWEGPYPALRGYQFYSGLEFAAEQSGDWNVAEALQRESLMILNEEPQSLDFKASAHFEMGTAAQMAGDHQTAQQQFGTAQTLFAQLPANLTTSIYKANVEVALAELEAKQGLIASATQRLASVAPKIGRVHNFRIQLAYWKAKAELARSRGLTAEEESCLSRVVGIGRLGFRTLRSERERWDWRREVGPAYVRLLEIEAGRPHDPAQMLADWESVHHNELAGDLKDAVIGSPATREALLQRISALRQATLVSFAALNGKVFIWVADIRGIHEFNLTVGPNQLAEEVRIFYTLCSDWRSSLDETKTHGRQLYSWLVAPIEENIRGRTTLLIETDGLLSGLAWPALVSRQGEYLGQSHAIASISGLQRGSMSPEALPDPIGRVVVAIPGATSSAGSQYQPLPNAEIEAKVILALYRNSVCLRNRDVSVDRLLKELPTVSIFHFAGHAQTREYGGALVLSGASSPETLSSRDLAQLRMPRCRLVVLSACATATAEQDVVRDPNGLIRSFLAAGAGNVVASHWEVDSKATAELMVNFYRQYGNNKAPVEALQLAMNHIRSQPATAHPYYWASFEVFGAATKNPPLPPRPSVF